MVEVNHKEVTEYADATYREIDYWCRKGWIHADKIRREDDAAMVRDWTQEEADVAREMSRLKDIGFRTEVTPGIARKIVAKRNDPYKVWPQDPVWIQLNDYFALEVN